MAAKKRVGKRASEHGATTTEVAIQILVNAAARENIARARQPEENDRFFYGLSRRVADELAKVCTPQDLRARSDEELADMTRRLERADRDNTAAIVAGFGDELHRFGTQRGMKRYQFMLSKWVEPAKPKPVVMGDDGWPVVDHAQPMRPVFPPHEPGKLREEAAKLAGLSGDRAARRHLAAGPSHLDVEALEPRVMKRPVR